MPEGDYISKVHAALKDNLEGFDKDEATFRTSMADSAYRANVYRALKDNLEGFDRTEQDFNVQIGEPVKKKELSIQPSQSVAQPLKVGQNDFGSIGERLDQKPFPVISTPKSSSASVKSPKTPTFDFKPVMGGAYNASTSKDTEDQEAQERIDVQRQKINFITADNKVKVQRIEKIQKLKQDVEEFKQIQSGLDELMQQSPDGKTLPPQQYEQYQSLLNQAKEKKKSISDNEAEIGKLYDASHTLLAGIRNIDSKYQNVLEKQFNLGKKTDSALKQTANNIVNSTGKIIQTIGDLNYELNEGIGLGALNGDREKKITDVVGKHIDEYYNGLEKTLSNELPASYKSYSPFGDKPDLDKLLYFGMNSTAQLVPTLGAALATGGAGAAVTGFTMEFGEAYDALHNPIKERYLKEGFSEKEAERKADVEAGLMATGTSYIVGQLDKIGVGGIIDNTTKKAIIKKTTQDALKNMGDKVGKESALQAIKKATKDNLVDFAKGYFKTVAPETLTEGVQELVVPAASDAYDVTTGTETFDNTLARKDTWVNAANAGLGALFASTPGGIGGGYVNISNPSNYETAMNIVDEDDFEMFKNALNKEVQSGNTTPEMAQSALENVQRIQEADKLIPSNIENPLQRSQGVALLLERQDIEKDIEGKDEALVGPQKERINEINGLLTKISKGEIIQNEPKEEQTQETPNTPEPENGTGVQDGQETKVEDSSLSEKDVNQNAEPPTSEEGVADNGSETPPVVSDTPVEEVRIPPTEKEYEQHNKQAEAMGFKNAPHGINSINKLLGEKFKEWTKIPEHVKKFVSGIRELTKQGEDLPTAIKGAYKYLSDAVKAGEITPEQAQELANKSAEPIGIVPDKALENQAHNANMKQKFITQLEALKEKFKSRIKGEKIGQKEATQRIVNLNTEFKNALKESGLTTAQQGKFIKHFGKITNVTHFNNAIIELDKALENHEYLDQAERVKKAYKKLKKLNKATLPLGDKEFVENLPNIKPRHSQDVGKLADMLEAITNGLKVKGKKVTFKEIAEFFRGEQVFAQQEYEKEQKEKAERRDVEMKTEYNVLKELDNLPPFVESYNDFVEYNNLLDAEQQNEDDLSAQQKQQLNELSKREELSAEATFVFLNEVEPNKEEILAGVLPFEKKIFDQLRKGDYSKLNANQLKMLINGMRNLAEYGDFAGLGQAASVMQVRDVLPTLQKAKTDGVAFKELKNLSRFIQAISNGNQRVMANIRSIMVGEWEKAINRIKVNQDRTLKQMSDIVTKNNLKQQDIVDLGTYSFLNNFDPNNKEADQKELLTHLIESAKSIYQNYAQKNATTTSKARRINNYMKDMANMRAESLKKMGLIEDYSITGNELNITEKENPNFDKKLTKGQQEAYDFAQKQFGELKPEVVRSIAAYQNEKVKSDANYHTRSVVRFLDKEEDVFMDSFEDFKDRYLSKTPSGQAKARVGLVSPQEGFYDMDFLKTFSQGLFNNSLIAKAPDAYAYMANIYNLGKGTVQRQLGEDAAKYFYGTSENQGALKRIIGRDKNYGNVSKDFRSNFIQAVDVLAKNTVAAILKSADQIVKQTIPSLMNMGILAPTETAKASQLMFNKSNEDAIEDLILGTTVGHRVLAGEKMFEKKYLTIDESKSVSGMKKFLDGMRKAQGSEILQWSDSKISVQAILAGYMKYMVDTGKIASVNDFNVQEAAKNPDSEALAYAEQFASFINNESNPNYQAQFLAEDKKRLLYLLQSFNMNAHQGFLSAVHDIFDKNTDSQTRNDNVRAAIGYLTQAVVYRAVRKGISVGLAAGAAALVTQNGDDKDEDDWTKTWLEMGIDIFLSDIMLGSSNVFTQNIVKAGASQAWALAQDGLKKEFADSLSEEQAKGTIYDKNYNPVFESDTKGAGAAGILATNVLKMSAEANKRQQMPEEKKNEYALAQDAAAKLAFMLTGMGTLNKVYGSVSKEIDKERRKLFSQYDKIDKLSMADVKEVMRKDLPSYSAEDRGKLLMVMTKEGVKPEMEVTEGNEELQDALSMIGAVVYVPKEVLAKKIFAKRDESMKDVGAVNSAKAEIKRVKDLNAGTSGEKESAEKAEQSVQKQLEDQMLSTAQKSIMTNAIRSGNKSLYSQYIVTHKK